jgi:hypothetical protein
VDKGVNKPHLTGKKPNNGGLYNKMPNPQADFLPIKINDLGNGASRAMAARARLEKKFSVHKWEGRYCCCAVPGIL